MAIVALFFSQPSAIFSNSLALLAHRNKLSFFKQFHQFHSKGIFFPAYLTALKDVLLKTNSFHDAAKQLQI